MERRLGPLPGGTSHALCCKRAFQVDKGVMLSLAKCFVYTALLSRQVMSVLAACLQEHLSGDGGKLANKTTEGPAEASKSLPCLKSKVKRLNISSGISSALSLQIKYRF